MTIAELYTWAVKNHVEDYPIKIQYARWGGYYYVTKDLDQSDISIEPSAHGSVVVLGMDGGRNVTIRRDKR